MAMAPFDRGHRATAWAHLAGVPVEHAVMDEGTASAMTTTTTKDNGYEDHKELRGVVLAARDQP